MSARAVVRELAACAGAALVVAGVAVMHWPSALVVGGLWLLIVARRLGDA